MPGAEPRKRRDLEPIAKRNIAALESALRSGASPKVRSALRDVSTLLTLLREERAAYDVLALRHEFLERRAMRAAREAAWQDLSEPDECALVAAKQAAYEEGWNAALEAVRKPPSNGGYTSHGHTVTGIPHDAHLKPPVHRCGGPKMCKTCRSDALALKAAHSAAQRVPSGPTAEEPLNETTHHGRR